MMAATMRDEKMDETAATDQNLCEVGDNALLLKGDPALSTERSDSAHPDDDMGHTARPEGFYSSNAASAEVGHTVCSQGDGEAESGDQPPANNHTERDATAESALLNGGGGEKIEDDDDESSEHQHDELIQKTTDDALSPTREGTALKDRNESSHVDADKNNTTKRITSALSDYNETMMASKNDGGEQESSALNPDDEETLEENAQGGVSKDSAKDNDGMDDDDDDADKQEPDTPDGGEGAATEDSSSNIVVDVNGENANDEKGDAEGEDGAEEDPFAEEAAADDDQDGGDRVRLNGGVMGPLITMFRDETAVNSDDDREEESGGEENGEGEEEGQVGDNKEEGDDDGETIEMEGEPQIAEHPGLVVEADFGDPSDPLSAPPSAEVDSLSPPAAGGDDDALAEDDQTVDEDADPTADVNSAADPGVNIMLDEATSGFLDRVNSGTINSAQFLPAIVDLPEKVKKKKTRKPKVPAATPPVGGTSANKKKRKREPFDSSDESVNSDAEYQPSSKKQRRKSTKKAGSGGARKTRATTAQPAKRGNNRREALFSCRYCDFKTETIGELNIHTFGNHDDSTRPTFLDMAEATVAKIGDRNGTSRTTLLRAIIADYGHVVEVNTVDARLILNNSVRCGIELGRLKTGVPGKKGANSIWLPSKDERKVLVQRFTVNPSLLHVEDRTEKGEPIVPSIKKKPAKGNLEVDKKRVKTSTPARGTKNSGGKGRPTAANNDDDEICVVEEKLTPMARLKAKAYANAKAALAKQLPASLLRGSGGRGGTKMVRIGPGGVVRAEGGRIVTTIDPSPLLKTALGAGAATKLESSSSKADHEDDDDDLSCHLCLSSFWYRNELVEHLKSAHSLEEARIRNSK